MSAQPEKQGPMPLLQLLPNLVTLAGLCLGVTSIRFTMAGRFDLAVTLILLAVVIDGLDGLLARRLQASSEFGAQLDSLSDLICFAVAPGLLVYRFALGEANALGWVLVLVYVAAGALRLARFNVSQSEDTGLKTQFIGVPSPGGALLPVFVTLAGYADLRAVPGPVSLWLAVVGVLMMSRLRTFSPKAVRIPRGVIGMVLIATVIAVGLIFTRFWALMVLIDAAYIAILAFSVLRGGRNRGLSG